MNQQENLKYGQQVIRRQNDEIRMISKDSAKINDKSQNDPNFKQDQERNQIISFSSQSHEELKQYEDNDMNSTQRDNQITKQNYKIKERYHEHEFLQDQYNFNKKIAKQKKIDSNVKTRQGDPNSNEKSSQFIADGDVFDRTFEEMVKQNESMRKNNPLPTDKALKYQTLKYGIIPNQRHLDKRAYQDLISKQYLTGGEKKTMQKLETFLKSDKMTHKELYIQQELKRRRANLDFDDEAFMQKQVDETVNSQKALFSN